MYWIVKMDCVVTRLCIYVFIYLFGVSLLKCGSYEITHMCFVYYIYIYTLSLYIGLQKLHD